MRVKLYEIFLFLQKILISHSHRAGYNGALDRVPMIQQSVLGYLAAYLHVWYTRRAHYILKQTDLEFLLVTGFLMAPQGCN